MSKSKKPTSKKPETNIIESRAYDIFVPAVVGSRPRSRPRVTHRQEVLTVHTIELAGCAPYDETPLLLWERWPSIPAQLWSRYSRHLNDPPHILVVGRPGYAPFLVAKDRIDDIHHAPIPGVMDEIVFPIASDKGRDEWLVYLALSEVYEDDGTWSDDLIQDAHEIHGGMPYSHSEYVRAMRRVPRVKAILDVFEGGGPIPLPFVRWTYGQSIVLSEIQDRLREAGEGDIDEVIAVETVINGYNNHF